MKRKIAHFLSGVIAATSFVMLFGESDKGILVNLIWFVAMLAITMFSGYICLKTTDPAELEDEEI